MIPEDDFRQIVELTHYLLLSLLCSTTVLYDAINVYGGEFILLVCEFFCVWTPFALLTLFTIAYRTTVKNGVSRQLARKQLLRHLSVTIWQYNTKMILQH